MNLLVISTSELVAVNSITICSPNWL